MVDIQVLKGYVEMLHGSIGNGGLRNKGDTKKEEKEGQGGW